MRDHGRMYGDRRSHPIPIWNGILEHRGRMSGAIWEFLWCIDRVTRENDGVGLVLGGQPITAARILKDVPGADIETIRLHLKALEEQGYIRRCRTPYGHVIEVLKSNKRGIWKSEKSGNTASYIGEKPQNSSGDPIKHRERTCTSGENKEDTAVTQQDTAVVCSDVWEFLGMDGSQFSPSVRELCRNFYRNKAGQTPAEFLGGCMDGIEALGMRIPPVIAARAKTLRSAGKTASETLMPELEAEPWAK